jgi:hypothetical protein
MPRRVHTTWDNQYRGSGYPNPGSTTTQPAGDVCSDGGETWFKSGQYTFWDPQVWQVDQLYGDELTPEYAQWEILDWDLGRG